MSLIVRETVPEIPLQIPKLMAIYVQKAVDGGYNSERIPHFEKLLNDKI